LLTGPNLVGPYTTAQVLEFYRLGEEKRKAQRIKELKAYHTSIGSRLWDDKPPLPGFPMPEPVTMHMTRACTAAIGPHPTAEQEFWRKQNALDVQHDREQHPEFYEPYIGNSAAATKRGAPTAATEGGPSTPSEVYTRPAKRGKTVEGPAGGVGR